MEIASGMRVRFLGRCPSVLVLLAAACWFFLGIASLFHQTQALHSVCPHGDEIVEFQAGNAVFHPDDELANAPEGEGAHDVCSLPALPPSLLALAARVPPPPVIDPPATDAMRRLDAPTCGPLRYAPKTSPPAAA